MGRPARRGAPTAKTLPRLTALGLVAGALAIPAATAQPLSGQQSSSLPRVCPAQPLVASTLKFTLQKQIITYTSLTYGANFPSGPNPVHATQKTCYYDFPPLLAAKGDIVPVTITFEFPVTKPVFAAARTAASKSVLPISIPGLGDAAWYVKPPLADPRGGNSLFVLSGHNEVVVGAPPQATVAMLIALVRKLL